jgi:hypothetical protein
MNCVEMDDSQSDSILHTLLGQDPAYVKEQAPHQFREAHKDAIVYEDDHVIAVQERDTEHPDGSDAETWKRRVILAPKNHVESLLDLDVADGRTAAHLLRGIQKVALSLGLEKHGFEIAIDVLPPRQHANLLKIKIRSGEKGTKLPS